MKFPAGLGWGHIPLDFVNDQDHNPDPELLLDVLYFSSLTYEELHFLKTVFSALFDFLILKHLYDADSICPTPFLLI